MYSSVIGENRTQKTIEKSRFITTSAHIESEEAVKQFIEKIKREFADATHNCYAYIADDKGNFLRFSDDGEPSGTAGMPILEVIKNKKLCQTAVVVTRYFGGIKLGAGGLVRAYSSCAAENLQTAKKANYILCSENEYLIDYSFAEAFVRYCARRRVAIIETSYGSEVRFTVVIKKDEESKFDEGLVNRFSGNIVIAKLKEYFFPFEE